MKLFSFYKNMNAIKKIFFIILTIHIAYFFYFVFTNFSDAIAIKEINKKLLLIILATFIAGILYFIWFKKIKIIHRVVSLIWNILFNGYILFLVYFLLGYIFNPPITLTQLGSFLKGDGLAKHNISLNEMSPNIKLAVIASEDQLFPDHDGFDLKEIKLAIKYNKKHPGKLRGGSTISQQVAKNIFLWQGRNMIRKGLEVFFTFTIETGWTKKIILERYLNIAEMGKGVFGVQAAAKKYFNKNAKDLSRAEAAQIAACLPNPKLYTINPLSKYISGRYPTILQQMNNIESDSDIQDLIK